MKEDLRTGKAVLKPAAALLLVIIVMTGLTPFAWADPEVTFYTLPKQDSGDVVYSITAGPGDNIWFGQGDYIGKITTSGDVSYFDSSDGVAESITTGPDDNIWFDCGISATVGKMTTSGERSVYSISSLALEHWPIGIASGDDGNVWFLNLDGRQIAKVTTGGDFTFYSLSTVAGWSSVATMDLTAGPDGNIWYCSHNYSSGVVGKVTSSGSITDYTVDALPTEITSGSDGNLWFITSSNVIGKVTTSGGVTLYTDDDGVSYADITSGSDGNLWFTCESSVEGRSGIGMITTSGAISHYWLSNLDDCQYTDITSGNDGNIWFTSYANKLIGKAVISSETLTASGKFLIWQNSSSGEVRWWNLSTSGKIMSDTEGTGHGQVTDQSLSSDWRFAGNTKLNGSNTLFFQNTSTGKVAYWKLNDSCELSASGLVSQNITVGSDWKAVGVKSLNDTPTIIWQNQSTGKVVYWKLSDSGTLADETRDSGWGFVSDSITVNSNWRLSSITTLNGTNVLLWQNQQSGKNVYWKLGSDNKLIDADQDSGWGFVTSLTLNSQWSQIGLLDSNYLIWQAQEAGKILWWRLGDDAKLVSEEQNTGWAFVSDNLTLNSNWSLGALGALDGTNFLLWHNEDNGKAVYWKLNSSYQLQDENQNSGWGFISSSLTMSGDWELDCITD